MMNVEQARDLKSNILWGNVLEELDKKIYNISEKFHTCTPEQLPLLQMEVRVIRSLKNLPDDIIEREENTEGRVA